MSKSKLTRVDKDWDRRARAIMKIRLEKNLAKFNQIELGTAEFTRLSLRCPSWPQVEKELCNLPKRRTNEK